MAEFQPKRTFAEGARLIAAQTAQSRGLSLRASEILPRLYLSDVITAGDVKTLVKLRITHIVSVIDTIPPENMNYQCERLHVRLEDALKANILLELDRTTPFIRDALAQEKENAAVLVHCVQGMSRSVTVVAAYLAAEHGMSPSQALKFIKERRPEAAPNIGFLQQLHTYGRTLGWGDTTKIETSNRAHWFFPSVWRRFRGLPG